MLTSGTAMCALAVLRGTGDTGLMFATGFLALMGIANLLSVGVQLPAWARRRASQMESITARTIDANLDAARALPEGS